MERGGVEAWERGSVGLLDCGSKVGFVGLIIQN